MIKPAKEKLEPILNFILNEQSLIEIQLNRTALVDSIKITATAARRKSFIN